MLLSCRVEDGRPTINVVLLKCSIFWVLFYFKKTSTTKYNKVLATCWSWMFKNTLLTAFWHKAGPSVSTTFLLLDVTEF